jgi:hypothetical protein
MPPKKESFVIRENLKSRETSYGEKQISASDLAGKTKVSSVRIAMAFDKASRRTGAFTSKYAK